MSANDAEVDAVGPEPNWSDELFQEMRAQWEEDWSDL
jgi:hypothetical protein